MGIEALLMPREVVARLGLGSTRTLESWRRRGAGPAYVRVGKLVRYRPADLDRWLDGRTVGGATAPAPGRLRALPRA